MGIEPKRQLDEAMKNMRCGGAMRASLDWTENDFEFLHKTHQRTSTPTRICRGEAKLQRPRSVEPIPIVRLDAVCISGKTYIHIPSLRIGKCARKKGQGWVWDGGMTETRV